MFFLQLHKETLRSSLTRLQLVHEFYVVRLSHSKALQRVIDRAEQFEDDRIARLQGVSVTFGTSIREWAEVIDSAL